MLHRRRLSDRLTLIRTRRFPQKNALSGHPFNVTIGIGGNLGDVGRRFAHLLAYLQRDRRVHVAATGPILINPPFGFTEQADFLNSVIVLQTGLQPRELMRYLLRVERRFGRVRTFANAPRTLDLDILFFDDRRISRHDLVIPHPHWQTRESVLIPLAMLPQRKR